MTNIIFKAVRKSCGYEWESYLNTSTNTFLATCHRLSLTVEAETWDALWSEITRESKNNRKAKKANRRK